MEVKGTVTHKTYLYLADYKGVTRSYASWVLRQAQYLDKLSYADHDVNPDIVITDKKAELIGKFEEGTKFFDFSNVHERTDFEKYFGIWGEHV